jgi:peptidoglycan hydrolase FlgJ
MTLPIAKFNPNAIALDGNALSGLKRTAAEDPQKALRATAQQFETVFMNMLMKSMRDTLPKDGMLSSSANDMYTGMLDQQLAQKMSSRGTGIADMIVKQLSQHVQGADGKANANANANATAGMRDVKVSSDSSGSNRASNDAPGRLGEAIRRTDSSTSRAGLLNPLSASIVERMKANPNEVTGRVIRFDDESVLTARLQGIPLAANPQNQLSRLPQSEAPRAFMRQMAKHAESAERVTGVPAKFMMGQAALESGWGRREITHPDGRSAHNLFGVKAGSSWTGKTVSVTTTEYVNGAPQKVVEKFRAYESHAESFRDYASLIAGNPRYADVIRRGGTVEGFANAMQRAGYATDPRYAEKLSRTINHMIQLKQNDHRAEAQVRAHVQAQRSYTPRDI